MKKVFTLLFVMFASALLMQGCTIDFSTVKSPFEQIESKWSATNFDMCFTVSEDNYKYGSSVYGIVNLGDKKDEFFIVNTKTSLLFLPLKAKNEDGIDLTTALLEGEGKRVSDSEYKFMIKDTKIELGGIEEITFIREDAESEMTD